MKKISYQQMLNLRFGYKRTKELTEKQMNAYLEMTGQKDRFAKFMESKLSEGSE